jgi:hypothetical protein
MGPSDLEEILRSEPPVPVRLTLTSGDQVIIANPINVHISDYTLVCALSDSPGRIKFVSIPNIALAERLDPRRRPQNGHTRRRRK